MSLVETFLSDGIEDPPAPVIIDVPLDLATAVAATAAMAQRSEDSAQQAEATLDDVQQQLTDLQAMATSLGIALATVNAALENITQQVSSAQAAATNADAKVQAAEAARSEAVAASVNAGGSAAAAGQSETNAQSHAVAAGSSATAASTSASLSQSWASQPNGTVAGSSYKSSYAYAVDASGAATTATAAAGTAVAKAGETTTNAAATAADRVQTSADRIQTGLDKVATAADRVQTGADRTQTGLDKAATAADRVQTGADRTQTGLDRAATAADRVQTGLDRTSTAANAAAAAASAAQASSGQVNADWSATSGKAQIFNKPALAASALTDTTNASNIGSGTLPAARLPAPTATEFGGVKAASRPANQFMISLSTAGVAGFAQPVIADVNGLQGALDAKAPLGGAGASGTWNISISGNAATATVAVNISAYVINQNLGFAHMPTFAGMDLTNRAYVNGAVWAYGGNTIGNNNAHGVVYLGNTGGNYVYWNGSSYVMPGGNIISNGSEVLTSGNYTNYAPTKAGAGASGTWPISITGTAAAPAYRAVGAPAIIPYNLAENSTIAGASYGLGSGTWRVMSVSSYAVEDGDGSNGTWAWLYVALVMRIA